jgi:thiol-disulfide isomerase/thioredoxin
MSPLRRLMYFEKDGCAPCKEMRPIAEAIAAETGLPIEFVDVNGDNGLEHTIAYRVKSAPTLIVIGDKGERIGGMIGKMISLARVQLYLR